MSDDFCEMCNAYGCGIVGVCPGCLDGIKKENAELKEDQRWRSVKDELPEDFESVLLYHDGEVREGIIEKKYWWAWSLSSAGKISFDKVTHWMPLPEFK